MSRNIYRKHRNGFTLVEVLFSLSITLIITVSLTSFYRVFAHSQNILDYNEDIYIAAKQISQYVIGTRYKEVGVKYTYVDLDEQVNEMIFDKGRIVKTPGYEIILTDIDGGYFQISQDHIYLNVIRNEENYRFLITYAKSFEIEEEVNE